MKRLSPLRVLLALAIIVAPLNLVETARADNPPRKILTGWLPYYSMSTYLPAVLSNADLIGEIMPFWYTLRYDGKTKKPVVVDVYKSANQSVPMETPLAALRNSGMKIISTITDGSEKFMFANLISKRVTRK